MSSPLGPGLPRFTAILVAALLPAASALAASTPARRGATIPWTTYEAEAMKTSGEVLGPRYDPYNVETESSGQRCVKLATPGAYLEFTATAAANALVVRYNLPDAPNGGGTSATLTLRRNGRVVRTLPLSSRDAYLYGAYPFSNDPHAGKPRNFYDELRVKDLTIVAGDVIRLEKPADNAPYCIVDLVDLEAVAPPLEAPPGSLSLLAFGAGGQGATDDTVALRAAVAAAAKAGKVVWVPAGEYRLTGDIVVPSSVTIQGAGMWHTTFVGDAALYAQADRRVRFKLAGDHIHLADFAIVGALNYRNDNEPNDGIVTAGCADSTVARIWIEHTKIGAWIYNGARLTIEGCRFRDLLADGVNLCVGTRGTVVQDCTARGTGDDCFAIWPAPADQGFVQQGRPGENVIRRCTGQLPFLANGGALYGGYGNRIEDCRFTDIIAGCGILISTTFPTSDAATHVDNNFNGSTVVERCDLVRCGGYDHDWAWRGALQICLDHRSISGLAIRDVNIRDSFSDGLTIVAPGSARGEGTLAQSSLEHVTVAQCGLGVPASHAFSIRADAVGSITVIDSKLADVQNASSRFTIERRP